jgi:hypothetical protein
LMAASESKATEVGGVQNVATRTLNNNRSPELVAATVLRVEDSDKGRSFCF